MNQAQQGGRKVHGAEEAGRQEKAAKKFKGVRRQGLEGRTAR
jgi:hypothetical protein